MFCEFCGSKIIEGSLFCDNCGKQVIKEAVAAPNPNEASNSLQTASTRSNKAPFVIIAVLSVLLICALGFIIVTKYQQIKAIEAFNLQLEEAQQAIIETEEEMALAIIEAEEEAAQAIQDTENQAALILAAIAAARSESEVVFDGYIFPSDRQYITENDMQHWDQTITLLARNEIFARHGYMFQTEYIQNYFSAQSWYTPNAAYKGENLSAVEQANVQTILAYEGKMGWQ